MGECSCTGNSLDRLVRPCVMAVLAGHAEGLHGYVIAQHLKDIAIFANTPPDMTGLYRVLRSMEEEGYLRGNWDTEGAGPARRTYALTEEGWDCLRHWNITLDTYARHLRETIKYIEQSIATGAGSVIA